MTLDEMFTHDSESPTKTMRLLREAAANLQRVIKLTTDKNVHRYATAACEQVNAVAIHEQQAYVITYGTTWGLIDMDALFDFAVKNNEENNLAAGFKV